VASDGRCPSEIEKHTEHDQEHRRSGVKIDHIRGVEQKLHTNRDQEGCAK
jgi:hypothetical protein